MVHVWLDRYGPNSIRGLTLILLKSYFSGGLHSAGLVSSSLPRRRSQSQIDPIQFRLDLTGLVLWRLWPGFLTLKTAVQAYITDVGAYRLIYKVSNL